MDDFLPKGAALKTAYDLSSTAIFDGSQAWTAASLTSFMISSS